MCRCAFDTADERDAHLCVRSCQSIDRKTVPAGVTWEQNRKLYARFPKGTSDIERRYYVWNILFPDTACPPHSFIDLMPVDARTSNIQYINNGGVGSFNRDMLNGIDRSATLKLPLDAVEATELMSTGSRQHKSSAVEASGASGHIESDDESVISAVFSDPSLDSSRSSTHTDLQVQAIFELAELLYHDDEMTTLYPLAISKLGRSRFQRNFMRLLKQYSKNLEREATEELYFEAARFIRRHARRVANGLANRAQPGGSYYDNDEEDNFSDSSVSSDAGDTSTNIVIPDSEYDVSISLQISTRARTIFKWSIERITGYRLSWWPLSQPETDPIAGYTRIYSKSPKGTQFYDDMSTPLPISLFPKLANVHSLKTNWWMECWGREIVQLHKTTLATIYVTRPGLSNATTATPQAGPSPAQSNSQSISNVPGQLFNNPAPTANNNQPNTTSYTTPPGQNSTTKPNHLVFLSADIAGNASRARTVKLGGDDLETFQNLRKAHYSFALK
ncbi:hypothetical protein O1611_g7274 [Lasiodiplodia mahajangana]|uniref:Uncharacterized protein n=1 Tax=Lasiodiplodia mahajangana TaxID=1108764 RepID=A0ACC2JFS5_9PEZI|nr:hypothetical protein O1611_g7274 [Lasiodiplodia mahajangana]